MEVGRAGCDPEDNGRECRECSECREGASRYWTDAELRLIRLSIALEILAESKEWYNRLVGESESKPKSLKAKDGQHDLPGILRELADRLEEDG